MGMDAFFASILILLMHYKHECNNDNITYHLYKNVYCNLSNRIVYVSKIILFGTKTCTILFI